MKSLPCITPELPGIGGRIKAEPTHFVVEEIPLYEPIDRGEHVYVRLTREGWTGVSKSWGTSRPPRSRLALLPQVLYAPITYTGPIYGHRLRWASGQPGELEGRVLAEAEVTTEMLRKARLDGSRRPARLFVDDLAVEPHPEGLLFSFSLPKGSYATTVLREFIKAEVEMETSDEAESRE